MKILFFLFATILLVSALAARAQTNDFDYQGTLKLNGVAANGNYDFSVSIYLDPTTTSPIASRFIENVAVVDGVFSVNLTFGLQSILDGGGQRFLEIRVRPSGNPNGNYTVLTPRQQVRSSPYSIKSLKADLASDALQLGGVAANQYVTTANGGASFIQNTSSQQASSNFNVSGTGTADIFNALTQFNINGTRVLSIAGSNNIFVGVNAGPANNGASNSFYGASSGQNNTTGEGNSFFGSAAGFINQVGSGNSYFGSGAGGYRIGNNNSVFGNAFAPFGSLAGDFNALFGHRAGESTSGSLNTFIGTGAGFGTGAGSSNTFIGHNAGDFNFNGSFNTALGEFANFFNNNSLTNATAIGYRAVAGQNNSLVLGSINGVNGCNSANFCDSVNVGIGTISPTQRLHVVGNSLFTGNLTVSGTLNATLPSGSANYIQNGTAQQASSNFNISGNGIVGGNLGIGTSTPSQRLHVVGNSLFGGGVNLDSAFPRLALFNTNDTAEQRRWDISASGGVLRFGAVNDAGNSFIYYMGVHRGPGFSVSSVSFSSNVAIGLASSPDMLAVAGTISFGGLGTAGGTPLCRNGVNQIAFCSSSLRYKSNISQYSSGMSFINQLRPISYDWKDGGMKDVGFGAEDVAKIDPRFVTYNDKGEVEGVKYDRLSVAFVNAFTEQQEQIESLKSEVQLLKAALCSEKPSLKVCRPKK